MNYKEFNDLFNRRAKGRDYKLYNSYHALCKDENDNLLVTGTTWVKKDPAPEGKKNDAYEHKLNRSNVYATISPDSVLTLMQTVNHQGIYNLFNKLIACGRLYCDNKTQSRTAKYRIQHSPRHNASVTKWDVPAAKGLQINLATGTVVYSPPDLRKVTDRTAAAPIYKRVAEVVTLMTILRRMGAIDDKDRKWGDHKALAEADKSMGEQNMVALAEAAYMKARSVTSGDKNAYNRNTGTWVPSAERAADFEKRLITNARRHLIKVLKEEHGGFALVPN